MDARCGQLVSVLRRMRIGSLIVQAACVRVCLCFVNTPLLVVYSFHILFSFTLFSSMWPVAATHRCDQVWCDDYSQIGVYFIRSAVVLVGDDEDSLPLCAIERNKNVDSRLSCASRKEHENTIPWNV